MGIARLLAAAIVAFALNFGASSANAASLRVSRVLLDLKAQTASATLRVWNDARRPINVQIRVFRWVQRNGEDVYEQTGDVVASPPITTLQPRGENLIRIVRTTNRPVSGEESYRLIVDELPDPSSRQAGTVSLVVRHSIPLFFSTVDAPGANPSWTVQPRRGGVLVTVRNDGAMRLRVSNMVVNSGGAAVARRDGLVGYVLGGSIASWFVPAARGGGISGGQVTISAESEAGRFNANARLQGG